MTGLLQPVVMQFFVDRRAPGLLRHVPLITKMLLNMKTVAVLTLAVFMVEKVTDLAQSCHTPSSDLPAKIDSPGIR